MVTSRIRFTSARKAELSERWKQGQSISSISRSLDRRTKGGVQRIVSLHGGIAPPARRRAASALELGEREEISRGIAAGLAIRAIARSLGRPDPFGATLPTRGRDKEVLGHLVWRLPPLNGEGSRVGDGGHKGPW